MFHSSGALPDARGLTDRLCPNGCLILGEGPGTQFFSRSEDTWIRVLEIRTVSREKVALFRLGLSSLPVLQTYFPSQGQGPELFNIALCSSGKGLLAH